VTVLPAEVLLIAHLLPIINGPVPDKHLLYLPTLLVLTPLASCEVFQSLSLLTHASPKILVLLDDAVV
jgi:hypothetical protein